MTNKHMEFLRKNGGALSKLSLAVGAVGLSLALVFGVHQLGGFAAPEVVVTMPDKVSIPQPAQRPVTWASLETTLGTYRALVSELRPGVQPTAVVTKMESVRVELSTHKSFLETTATTPQHDRLLNEATVAERHMIDLEEVAKAGDSVGVNLINDTDIPAGQVYAPVGR